MVRYSRRSPRISFLLLANHLSRPVMGIYDVVADFELDVNYFYFYFLLGDLEVLQLLFH